VVGCVLGDFWPTRSDKVNKFDCHFKRRGWATADFQGTNNFINGHSAVPLPPSYRHFSCIPFIIYRICDMDIYLVWFPNTKRNSSDLKPKETTANPVMPHYRTATQADLKPNWKRQNSQERSWYPYSHWEVFLLDMKPLLPKKRVTHLIFLCARFALMCDIQWLKYISGWCDKYLIGALTKIQHITKFCNSLAGVT
jgi:hypothetical protein